MDPLFKSIRRSKSLPFVRTPGSMSPVAFLRYQQMVCSRALEDQNPGSPCYNLILLEDDIPTFGRLQQSMTSPPPHPTSPPSHPTYLHICKHGPILFAPTKADPSRGEGSHSPSGPSLRLPCRMVTKQDRGAVGGKKAYSPRAQSHRVSASQ